MATAGGHNASPPKAPQGCPSAISAGGDLVGRVPGGAAPPRVTEGLVCADWAPPARRRGQCGGGLPYAKTGGVGGGGARLNRCGCGCVEKDTWSRPPLSLPCRAPTFPVLGTARALRLRGPLEVERAPARHCPPRSVPRGGCTSATIRIRLRFLWATKNYRDLGCVSGRARRTRRPPPRLSARPGWVRAIDLRPERGERKISRF